MSKSEVSKCPCGSSYFVKGYPNGHCDLGRAIKERDEARADHTRRYKMCDEFQVKLLAERQSLTEAQHTILLQHDRITHLESLLKTLFKENNSK